MGVTLMNRTILEALAQWAKLGHESDDWFSLSEHLDINIYETDTGYAYDVYAVDEGNTDTSKSLYHREF